MSDENATPGSAQEGTAAAVQATVSRKREPRTPEEMLTDIEAEERKAILRVQQRAAKQKAEVKQKLCAAARKTAAVDMLDGFRAGVKEALKNLDLSDADADAALKKIVTEGLSKLAAEAAAAPAAPAANAAPITLAA